jgi:hypothetical protein
VCLNFSKACLIAVAATAALPGSASAEDTGVVYAGGSVEDGFNAFGGAVVALPGGTLGHGLALRGGASAGRYEYMSGSQAVTGEYLSGEAALVYQTSGPWGWANFSAGPRLAHTSLSPADPSNELAGTRWDAAAQTDGALGNGWRFEWLASAGAFRGTYNTQGRFGPLLNRQHQSRAGLEAGFQGDPSYSKRSLGIFLSTGLGEKIQGRLSAGLADQDDQDPEPYAGIALSRTF